MGKRRTCMRISICVRCTRDVARARWRCCTYAEESRGGALDTGVGSLGPGVGYDTRALRGRPVSACLCCCSTWPARFGLLNSACLIWRPCGLRNNLTPRAPPGGLSRWTARRPRRSWAPCAAWRPSWCCSTSRTACRACTPRGEAVMGRGRGEGRGRGGGRAPEQEEQPARGGAACRVGLGNSVERHWSDRVSLHQTVPSVCLVKGTRSQACLS